MHRDSTKDSLWQKKRTVSDNGFFHFYVFPIIIRYLLQAPADCADSETWLATMHLPHFTKDAPSSKK
jgi:hypothetical protein